MVMGRNDQVPVVVRDGVSMAEIFLDRNDPELHEYYVNALFRNISSYGFCQFKSISGTFMIPFLYRNDKQDSLPFFHVRE